jgi:hypothetical protein
MMKSAQLIQQVPIARLLILCSLASGSSISKPTCAVTDPIVLWGYGPIRGICSGGGRFGYMMTLSNLMQRIPTDTFQAVIIIGGATLAFALLQVEPSTLFRCGKLTKLALKSVLQVLQVVLAQQQVNQGNPGPQDLRLLVRELRDVLKSDL